METVLGKPVLDKKKKRGRLSDAALGKLLRVVNEIIKRDGISFDDAMEVMHKIILQNKSADHLKVIHRTHHIVPIKYIMHGDSDITVPEGCPSDWQIYAHQKNGKLNWKPDVVGFDSNEPRSRTMNFQYGHEVFGKFEGQTLPNANILDFYLKHPWLIPEEWKGSIVYFFGTIYVDEKGKLYVRRLEWQQDKNKWHAMVTCYADVFFPPNMVVATFSEN